MTESFLGKDGLVAHSSGDWIESKFHCLRRYLNIFSVAIKNKWELYYVNLFVGPGLCKVRETQEEINGSPLIALLENDFDKYYFFEADPASERLAAAEKMKKAGWPIRFRLDPMIPFPNWKKGYGEAILRINALSPEMVTLGSLRATSYNGLRNASKANGRDESTFDYLTEEKDPSGFKYRLPFEKQVEMFRFAMSHLKTSIKPALCKEDRALWKALGMHFDGCHCLLGRNDSIVKERHAEMKQPKSSSRIIGLGDLLPILA